MSKEQAKGSIKTTAKKESETIESKLVESLQNVVFLL